jgi:two-component system, cell cycle sensor histidine kinase and response regulator CckA
MPYIEKILIVDDERRMCESLKDLLSGQSYEIKTFCSGQNALECLAENTFDLVLLDIGMEAMDGFQVMESMAQKHLDIPVIIMTGNASTASAVEALRRGAYDYLRKPFQPEELFTSVKNALNQGMLKKDNDRVHRKLRESETRLRSLSDNLPGGLVYQIDTGKDGSQRQFLFISAGVKQLHGITVSQALDDAKIIYDQIDAADQVLVAEREAFALTNLKPFNVEVRLRLPSGEMRWRLFTSSPRRMPNHHLCWDGIEIDITERKQAEEARKQLEAQNRQLQKAESLSRMAGAIAHHFNNQLNVVTGNLEMALEELPQGVTLRETLTESMNAARKAAEVSSLMLTYLGETTAKKEPIDISEVCRRSLSLLRAALPRTICMEGESPYPGPTINGNPNQIQQVLTSLIINAAESCESRGSVHLIVKTVSGESIPGLHRHPIDWQPQEIPYACLEVRDFGCGIADEDIEQIFDPFFTTKFTGRGLGLAVVLGILKAHSGAITVESEPGRGSIFRVFLPVSAEAVVRPPEKAVKARDIEGGGTVLLVEDEEQVRKMAGMMLTRLGLTVLEARDGVEAVEVFRQNRDEIRCVLSDLTMPRLNGWEMLTALRELSPGIPVVLASGYNESQVMAGDHPEKPDAFLHKPFSIKDLAAVIRQVLAQE